MLQILLEKICREEKVLDIDLLEEEKYFFELKININIDVFNQNLNQYVNNNMKGKTIVSKPELEALLEFDKEKPIPQLTTNQMKTVKNQLITNGFYKLNGMGREHMKKDEMTTYIKRYFITLLSKNDEFDHLLVTRMYTVFINAETKTFLSILSLLYQQRSNTEGGSNL